MERTTRVIRRERGWRGLSGLLGRAMLPPAGILLLGCGSESLRPDAVNEPPDMFWRLEVDHPSVVLSNTAPWDTLTVQAIPTNYAGDPLAGLPIPTFTSQNSDQVEVSATGQLIGKAPTPQPVWVLGSLTVDNLRQTDSVLVQVADNAEPPVLTHFAIDRPIPPDSAKIGVSPIERADYMVDTLTATGTDAAGAIIGGLLPAFRSSNTAVGVIDRQTGMFYGVRPGDVEFEATVTVFGVKRTDVLAYRIGYPTAASIEIEQDASGLKVMEHPKIGVGGIVIWGLFEVPGEVSVDIVFANDALTNIVSLEGRPLPRMPFTRTNLVNLTCRVFLTDCTASGNIDLDTSDLGSRFALRRFLAPGVYTFTSTKGGFTGSVTVVDER